MIESTRIVPVFPADIRAIGSSSDVEDYTEYTNIVSALLTKNRLAILLHEPNHGNDLDDCEDKFGLAIPFDTEQIDDHNDD